jgi:hypothetical protein
MTTWRYQPVFEEQDGIRSYFLCEVYFDEDGTLSTWTQNPVMAPSGEEIGELTDDLVFTIADSFSWEPVRFFRIESWHDVRTENIGGRTTETDKRHPANRSGE